MRVPSSHRLLILLSFVGTTVAAGVSLADHKSNAQLCVASKQVSLDLSNVTFLQLAEKIADQSGTQVEVARPLQDRRVSVLVDQATPEMVIANVASLHGLAWREDEKGDYHIYRPKQQAARTNAEINAAMSKALPRDFQDYLRLHLKKPDSDLIDPSRLRDIGPKRNLTDIVQDIVARDWNKEQAKLVTWFSSNGLHGKEGLKFTELPAEERERVILILVLRAIFSCRMSVLRGEPFPLHNDPTKAALSIDGSMIRIGGIYEIDGRKMRSEIGTEILP